MGLNACQLSVTNRMSSNKRPRSMQRILQPNTAPYHDNLKHLLTCIAIEVTQAKCSLRHYSALSLPSKRCRGLLCLDLHTSACWLCADGLKKVKNSNNNLRQFLVDLGRNITGRSRHNQKGTFLFQHKCISLLLHNSF